MAAASLKIVKDCCPKAGLGVVGGKGLASPLPPAARRAGDQARMPGNSRQLAEKKKGQEKAPPPYSRPKKRRALSPQSCQSSSGDTPRASAICRTVKTVKAGSLRLPRHGTGER